jgi:hypothetical protein
MGAAVDPPSVIQAAKSGDKDALRALIQKKADVNQAEADGATALHWASYHDDLNSADLLIHAGANVNAANDLGATPLWAASQNGSSAMVRRRSFQSCRRASLARSTAAWIESRRELKPQISCA